MNNTTKIWLIFGIFIIGLLFSTRVTSQKARETFTSGILGGNDIHDIPSNCPNVLIKKNGKLYLKNTEKMEVPGVNPKVFNDLNEYNDFMEWLRSQGVRCPVLYLEHAETTQGEFEYRAKPNVIYDKNYADQYKGYNRLPKFSQLLDAGHTGNNFPGYDPQNQYVGLHTPLDDLHHVQLDYNKSDNPMDSNWGGPELTQLSIDNEKYRKNVMRKTPIQLALEAETL